MKQSVVPIERYIMLKTNMIATLAAEPPSITRVKKVKNTANTEWNMSNP